LSEPLLDVPQRLLKALHHELPDRVPFDLGGNQTGIHRKAYVNLIRHLGIQDDIIIMDAVQQLARPCEAVLQRFHIDTRYIAAGAPASWKGGIVQNRRDGKLWHDLTDEFGITWSMPEDHPLYMDISHHPLANATIEDIKGYPFPKGDDPTRFTGLRERAQRLQGDGRLPHLRREGKRMRRVLRYLCAAAAIALSASGSLSAQEQSITIANSKVFGRLTRTPVVFPHQDHMAQDGLDCLSCHHRYEKSAGKKLTF
jgi:hypothetical protein